MAETQITVSYERKYSDGNYGSEGLSMSLSHWDDDGWSEDELRELARDLRKLVLTELSKSAAERVAWAAKRELNPPKTRDDAATESAELELAIGKREAYRDPDDDEDGPF